MICPNCSKELSNEDNYCPACGKRINKDISTQKNYLNYISFFLVVTIVLGLFVYVYVYLKKVGSTINLDDSNIPEILPKAENCKSPYIENEIISLFKKNDKYFNYISSKSIDSISINSKETLLENDKRYICSGIIEIKSSTNGFRPKNYEINNPFYQQIFIEDDNNKIRKYTFYQIPVLYSSSMIENENYAELNKLGNGNFSCIGNCFPVYKFKKKIETTIPKKEVDKKEIEIIKNEEKPQIEINTNENVVKKDSKIKRFFNFFRRKKKNKELNDNE